MTAPLAGRVALVTGVSRRQGIGLAIVQRLLQAGAAVLAQGHAAHDEATAWGADPGLGRALDELRAGRSRVAHVDLDLARDGAPAALVDDAIGRFGRLDALVANHARSSRGGVADVTAGELDACWAVNVRATLLLVQRFAARYDGGAGRVVLFTSGQHLAAMRGELAYVATKGALQQATRTLAAELAPRRITVNAVNPGPTDTGWLTDELRAELLRRSPFDRLGEPDDAARLVIWLCSDEARWITGQTLDSEGGYVR